MRARKKDGTDTIRAVPTCREFAALRWDFLRPVRPHHIRSYDYRTPECARTRFRSRRRDIDRPTDDGAHNSSQQWLEKHMPTNLFRYHLAASPHELFILWESLSEQLSKRSTAAAAVNGRRTRRGKRARSAGMPNFGENTDTFFGSCRSSHEILRRLCKNERVIRNLG